MLVARRLFGAAVRVPVPFRALSTVREDLRNVAVVAHGERLCACVRTGDVLRALGTVLLAADA